MSHILPLLQTGAPFTDPKTGALTEGGRRLILSMQGAFSYPSQTFANLPSHPAEGQLRGITDSTTAVWGDVIAGGGALHVLGYFNGTAWTVAGK